MARGRGGRTWIYDHNGDVVTLADVIDTPGATTRDDEIIVDGERWEVPPDPWTKPEQQPAEEPPF